MRLDQAVREQVKSQVRVGGALRRAVEIHGGQDDDGAHAAGGVGALGGRQLGRRDRVGRHRAESRCGVPGVQGRPVVGDSGQAEAPRRAL